MSLKWIGAILTVVSCGGFGFLAVLAHKQQEASLHQLSQMLSYMAWELEFRLTPLPDLCTIVAQQSNCALSHVFAQMAKEMEGHAVPDVANCIRIALDKTQGLPKLTVRAFKLLSESLGRYDLTGQLKALQGVVTFCQRELEKMSQQREERLRSYQILGFCAGVALVIIFI